MSPKEFIQNELKKLVELHPNICCRYEDDEMSSTHFIEIIPQSVFDSDGNLKESREQILFRFVELFPFQNLSFLTEDALVGIQNCTYSIKGNKFRDKVTQKSEITVKGAFFSNLSEFFGSQNKVTTAFEDLFKASLQRFEFMPNEYTNLIGETSFSCHFYDESMKEYLLLCENLLTSQATNLEINVINEIPSTLISDCEVNYGESNNALAA